MDECGIHIHAALAKGWDRIGQPLKTAATAEDRKRAVCWMLDYASWQLIHRNVPDKRGAQRAAFLEEMAATWRRGTSYW